MLRTLLATALACALGAPALAQTATISGTVVDESGAAVPGATVELIGPGSKSPTVSGARGEYGFHNVAPGAYRVQATLVGFATATRNDIVVSGSNVDVHSSRFASRASPTPWSSARRNRNRRSSTRPRRSAW